MQSTVLDRFRRALSARRDGVLSWLSSHPEDVEQCLGGCSTSEICVINEIDAAITCTETGEFGRCERCDGEVEVERLRTDFTTRVCLDCYTEAELRALERDLELAARVQQQLFPRFVPALEGFEIAAHVKPARFVGGDYYDFFPFSDFAQGVVVADVMGKGLAASMLMSNLQASIRILGPSYEDPARLLARLNELFRYNINMTGFISLLVAKIDDAQESIRYASAGHNPAILLPAGRQDADLLVPTGPAIGLVHEPQYESRALRFGEGDVLVLYTDGVSETRDGSGREFGVRGIVDVLRRNRDESPVELVDNLCLTLDTYSGGTATDDTTLLVVKRGRIPRGREKVGPYAVTTSGVRDRHSLADGGVSQ